MLGSGQHPREAARAWIRSALTNEFGAHYDSAAIAAQAESLDELAEAWDVPTEEIVKWIRTEGPMHPEWGNECVLQLLDYCQRYSEAHRTVTPA